ncbi:MAG: hypothetical protein ABSE89_06135 [Sedimentisphaerales bacterium]
MKHFIMFIIILTTMQCFANNDIGQKNAIVNWQKEIMMRTRKIEGLQKKLADIQKRISALIEYAESNDINLPNNFKVNKSADTQNIKRPQGMPASEWIAKQDKIIEGLGKEIPNIQKRMFMLMHYVSSKGLKIPEYASSFVPEPPPYINPEWQEDYSIGAVADVYKIKIFQQQKDNCALVQVQYKAPMREALVGMFKVSPYMSLPQTKWVAINRNTPKDTEFYGGTQRDGRLVDVPDTREGEWVVMQFRGFDLGKYTDGQEIELDMRCIIVESIRYQTAIGGTNTVFVAEPFMVK